VKKVYKDIFVDAQCC